MQTEVTYHLVKSDDNLTHLAHSVAEALKDSPFKDIAVDMKLLEETISRFCIDTSDAKRFALVAKVEDQVVGMIAASTVDDHFVFSQAKAGQEIIWWVHEDHRKTEVSKELMDCLDTWAKHNGLKHMFLSHYHNKYTTEMKKMYKAWGYQPVEYTYWKEME